MKKLVFILMMVLLCAQSFGLDTSTIIITITVNKPPVISGFGDFDGVTAIEGDELTITITATDANNHPLQYSLRIANANKDEWSPWNVSNEFQYTPGANDIGLNIIQAKVKDGFTESISQEVDIYVFRNAVDLPQ